MLKATLNRQEVEDIIDELTVFRVGTGDIPNRHEHIWCRWHGDNEICCWVYAIWHDHVLEV